MKNTLRSTMSTPFFLVEHFEDYLRIEKRYSEHTLLAYRKDVEQFIDFAGVSKDADLKEINHKLIRGWMVSMLEEGLVAKTVNRKISSLRTFLKWCLKNNYIESNPAKLIEGPKQQKRLPVFVQEKDMEEFSEESSFFTNDFEGKRDQLMLELFYQTGIRLSELINLKLKDISNDTIRVVGKRNKERIIPISKELHDLVLSYQKEKMNSGLTSDFLFVLINDKILYPKFVYRKINYYLGRAARMEKRSPHVLRHTFATHMMNNGAGLEILKEILGHANLSATQVYTHNSFAQLTNIYSQAHPRGHKKD